MHEFTEKLVGIVQALETMGKLKEINGYVRLTLDKLQGIKANLVKQGIKADLVRIDNELQEWELPLLVKP